MMNGVRSVLRFDKYVVSEIMFKMNENYEGEEPIELDFDFNSDTKMDGEKMVVSLYTSVFKNCEKKNYPFEIEVTIKGYFEIESSAENVSIDMFESNAIAILFPYLRALVSTYTANVNIAPVLIPAMNINAYLKNKRGK